MDAPAATSTAPAAPTVPAQQQAPPPPVGTAAPTQGIAQPAAAPPARRARNPRGPVTAAGTPASTGAPALLELGAAAGLTTVQRRAVNIAVPDANHLYHVLSICDMLMNSTHRFVQSSPAWLPIVSHLYISVLWWYQVMLVFANAGYGFMHADLLRNMSEYLRIDECMVPGPLVPFFEALAAVNGPFDWIGDVMPTLPTFSEIWNAEEFLARPDIRARVPLPIVLLDQLAYFATWNIPAQQKIYSHFEWYRNVFSVPSSANISRFRQYMMSPPGSASLYSTESQVDAARAFWNAAMRNFTRINAAEGQPQLSYVSQLFGFYSQTGHDQFEWFQHVTIVMQKYCQYFNGSRPLKAISPTGIGAFEIIARPKANRQTRDWLYPEATPGPFLSSVFMAPHPLPTGLRLDYQHADHDLEEVAEQYALTTTPNIKWGANNAAQHGWPVYNDGNVYSGSFWDMLPHREGLAVNMLEQYGQIIASRYHQVVANKST